MTVRRFAVAAVVGSLVFVVAPAQATFPGPNGQIAFNSPRAGDADIWLMDPDGSDQFSITPPGTHETDPAWAPQGQDIAFVRGEHLFVTDAQRGGERQITHGEFSAFAPAWSADASELAFWDSFDFAVSVIDSDGQGPARNISDVSPPQFDGAPDWSPAGDQIVFSRHDSGGSRDICWHIGNITLVDPEGNAETTLTSDTGWTDSNPSFSPDGGTVVFARKPDPCMRPPGPADLYTVPTAGGPVTQLTNTPDVHEDSPVWSPDGEKIAFAAGPERESKDIYVMNADGSAREQLTTDPGDDRNPNWHSGPAVTRVSGYPRPKSARRVSVPLVPAFAQCAAPNRTHGPPLAFDSCHPPRQASSEATVGTPDANGFPPQSTGRVQITAVPGDPSTTLDEADVRIKVRLTDVRRADEPAADYSAYAYMQLRMQMTDGSGCCRSDTTLRDPVPLYYEVPCVATADPAIGATCAVTTSAEALIPELLQERKRTVWEMAEPVRLYDEAGGVLATQGVFVP